MKIVRVAAIPLRASFADMFGGADKVPPQVHTPAAHFRRIRRQGQMLSLIEVEAEDGTIGHGEAFGLPHPLAAAAIVNEVIAPFLVGMTLGAPEEMLADMAWYFAALGHSRGAAMEALSGVDIALWDLKARAAGQPLATLLGASPGPIETYVSPVPFHDAPEDTARAGLGFIAQGFKRLKLKIGRGRETDLRHIAALREAVGQAVPIYLDANCAYDEEEAIVMAKALGPYDVGWFEEPIPPEDVAALARVRRASPVPIASGENEFRIDAYKAMVAAEAVDFLQPNITRAGGVSGLLATGRLCAKAGIGMAPHGVGGCVAVSAAAHACRAAEGFFAYEANQLLNPLRDETGLNPPEIENGAVIATDRPGHGGEPDPARIARYRIDTALPLQGYRHADIAS